MVGSKISKTLLSTLGLLSSGCGSSSDGHLAHGGDLGPYIQNVAPTSVVVSWRTGEALDGRVGFGIAEPTEAFVADAALRKVHEVELAGLVEGTTYVYVVTSGGKPTGDGSFKTAPPPGSEFSFAVYGDTRSDPAAHASVVKAILESDPDFVLHVGDIVRAGGNLDSWIAEFFTPAADLIRTKAFYPALGNHEYAGDRSAENYRAFFALPSATERWYSFDYGCAHFVCLDTCVPGDYAPGSEQRLWLEADLEAARESPWTFVFFHHPPYTASSGHSDDARVQADLVPLFEAGGVDAVFSGHTHAYERYSRRGIVYIVTGGGGAPLHRLAADRKEPVREAGESALHHVFVRVAPSAFALEARRNDGTAIDGISLERR